MQTEGGRFHTGKARISVSEHRPASFTVGIVGAGVMGRGIAQIAAECGMIVLLADMEFQAVTDAIATCASMIRRKAEKGLLSVIDAEAIISRICATTAGPVAGYAGFAACDLVVEAAIERMDIKHAVLAGVEAAVHDDCIIATNTSSLSVTEFAAGARIPGRVAGFHFFNPVPLMKIVEVIGGILTTVEVLDRLTELARRMGHYPVRSADSPGFLVNHAGRAYTTEALRIVSEGIADFADIDRVMTGAAGFRMGPFALLDLTGLDVSHAVMESIYHQYYEEPRYRPVTLTARRRSAGLLGRKTGCGFYTYVDGRQEVLKEEAPPIVDLSRVKVWIGQRHPAMAKLLTEIARTAGVRVEREEHPSSDALIVLTPFGEDTTTAALAAGVDPTRAIAIDCLLPLTRRRTLMRTPVTRPEILSAAWALFAADGTPVTIIRDSPGFIAQRILASIVNIGSDIAQQHIAVPADIDRAVELGLGYPSGPLKLGDALGGRRVLEILDAMFAFYGDPRYRASPWLKRRAILDVSLLTID